MNENIAGQLSSMLAHPEVSERLSEALQRAAGARFFKCALQVNPYDYLQRHGHDSEYEDEESYNEAILEACQENSIEVVAITDHFRFDSSKSLAELLTDAGICVFPGFEANSSEGVHVLCLFSQEESVSKMNAHIGACGVKDWDVESPQSDMPVEKLTKLIADRGGLSIAAHACGAGGILTVLSGQARARSWKCKDLVAAAIAGRPEDVQDKYRQIVLNKNPETRSDNPTAIINAGDVSGPEKLAAPGATTQIKMSSLSIEGLRQAFLDSDSRIRLNSQEVAASHTEILAIAWDGGLLDEQCVRLNEGLNVLVGGRGSGKSTFIESLRYAFDIAPRGEEALRVHKSILKEVVKPGTEISVLVHSPYPSPQFYLIRRIYGSAPRVYDQTGDLIDDLHPRDVAGDIEIYGQHEISEITRQPGEIAEILRRFVSTDEGQLEESEIGVELSESANGIMAELSRLEQLDNSLAALPELREKLKRFEAAGFSEKLQSKTQIDEELAVFDSLDGYAADLEARANELCPEELYEDILPEGFTDECLHPDVMENLGAVQDRIISASERARSYLHAVAEQSRSRANQIAKPWENDQKSIEKEYTSTLKQLSKKGIDGSAYISVREQIAKLVPKEKRRISTEAKIKSLMKKRSKLLATHEAETAKDLRLLKKAAKRVGKRLKGKVRVDVRASSDLSSLEDIIRKFVSGQISQAIEKLSELDNISLIELSKTIRAGESDLQKLYGFSKASAAKIAQGGEELALEVEQHRLQPEAILSLNVGENGSENWKTIDQLSTGQKATAVLLLLLLESDAPVIIDQPEDDLDNRFIVGSVVTAIRDEKRTRQFVFSSHNANIPVLGDAEQIIGLTPIVEEGVEYAEICEELCGSIDSPAVKELVKNLLEGGQAAFELRREKYGF